MYACASACVCVCINKCAHACLHVRLCWGISQEKVNVSFFGPQPVQVNNTFTHQWANHRPPLSRTSPFSRVHY